MHDDFDELIDEPGDEDDAGSDKYFIDILTGAKETPSAKKLLIQKVLRRLIESEGFSREDLEVSYKPQIEGHRGKKIDIAIFVPEREHHTSNLQRIILCKPQRRRDKLRSLSEAEADLRPLKELMELIPSVRFGMWTNDQEEFLFYSEHDRFEVRFKPLAIWPVPGEQTSDIERQGGVIQISADEQSLEETLSRCFVYLASNHNVGLGDKGGFQQLALLLFAKIFDETRTENDRNFWVKGDEPFTPEGHEAIQQRVNASLQLATKWLPGVLEQGWVPALEPVQTARIVSELSRFSLSHTNSSFRTRAFRSISRNIMDGRQGRYPTPLNVAELAIGMLDPGPEDRILDCAIGTGTFPAIAATHVFKKHLASLGTTAEEAQPAEIIAAQQIAADWTKRNVFGCDIDPFLAVTSRMNLLFTTGHPGQIFRLDAHKFPVGDHADVRAAGAVMPLETMDLVTVNPWFSTQETISDPSILQNYDLGKNWQPADHNEYRNSGDLITGGVAPEILFLERCIQWAKPGTGCIAILLPNGLLGNPAQRYVRWWILRHCEVLASIELPVEPFKVAVKEYGLTPALASLLVLRRRSNDELLRTNEMEYKVFMAIAERAGVDARGKTLYQRLPNGDENISEQLVVERVRQGTRIAIRKVVRRVRRVNDELPVVASKYREFLETGEVSR